MRINSIQSYNNNSNPNFGLNFYPTQSLQHAIYESRDLMTPVLYTEKNRKFLQKFCNSLAKIKKSKKADSISLYYSDFYKKYTVIEYTKNPNNVKKCAPDSVFETGWSSLFQRVMCSVTMESFFSTSNTKSSV